MEIRRVLRGEITGLASARSARRGEQETTAGRFSADRVELSRQWAANMEEQNARLRALLSRPAEEKKDEGGLLGYMETEEEKLDGLSEELDIQMKCLEIAMNMMKGKKVPPEDEKYLMEHDPDGYKMAMAMKAMVKEDKKECKSVLDEEDKNGGTSETSAAPVEDSSAEGGEAAE